MSKKTRGRRNKEHTRPKRRSLKASNTYSKYWKIGGGLIALITFFLTVYPVWVPRFSVSALPSLDPNNPLATPFAVTNDGTFAVTDVKFLCGINYIEFRSHTSLSGMSFLTTEMHADRIKPSEQATVQCDFIDKNKQPIIRGDIAIGIRYKPFLSPFRFSHWSRFVTAPGADGIYQWLPKPDK